MKIMFQIVSHDILTFVVLQTLPVVCNKTYLLKVCNSTVVITIWSNACVDLFLSSITDKTFTNLTIYMSNTTGML